MLRVATFLEPCPVRSGIQTRALRAQSEMAKSCVNQTVYGNRLCYVESIVGSRMS